MVVPFGLTNAPSVFQYHMTTVLGEYVHKFVYVYLDDILVFSKTKEEHLEHLRLVLTRLKENNLYIKAKKCNFLVKELFFLGHIIGQDGLKVDENKTKAVQEMERPQTVTEVQSFIGLVNYFRRFLPKIALTLKPLHALTHKGATWDWTNECEEAFIKAKQALVSPNVLALPDFTQPFEVVTDASDHHIGGILTQNGKPIAFESRLLNPTEQRYPTHDREFMAVHHCYQKWRCYLDGVESVVYTDHKPLKFIQEQPNLNPRQVRWLQFLESFRPSIVYRPGLGNPADPLTRLYSVRSAWARRAATSLAVQSRQGQSLDELCRPLGKCSAGRKTRSTNRLPVIRYSLQSDVSLPENLAPKDKCPLPVLLDRLIAGYRKEGFYGMHHDELGKKGYEKDKEVFFYVGTRGKKLLVIPNDLVPDVLHYCHDAPESGHLGIKKTTQLIQRRYWWPSYRNDVINYVNSCQECQVHKPAPKKLQGLLKPLEVPEGRFQSISMDFMTHFPKTERGHDAVFVMVDRFTKYVILVPCSSKITAEETAQIIHEKLFTQFGVPLDFVSDRDSKFTSEFFKDLCKLCGVTQSMSSGFHPQSDGQTERMNRLVQQVLRNYIMPDQSNWDILLPSVQFAINRAYNESTGASPFELVLGDNPCSPLDGYLGLVTKVSDMPLHDFKRLILEAEDNARKALQASQSRMKAWEDKRRKAVSYEIGQEVWLSTATLRLKYDGSRKLLPKYCGPFKIKSKVNESAFILDLPTTMKCHPTFHVDQLKPVKPGTRVKEVMTPPMEDDEGNVTYEVEQIIKYRIVKPTQVVTKANGKIKKKKKPYVEYLVKWVGYGIEHNTWQRSTDFTWDGVEGVREVYV